MKTLGIPTGIVFALELMLIPPHAARATTISTGAACSLVDAIDSANTNAAVGGCTAGAAGLDTIVVTQDVQLSIANNVSGVDNGSNGLPIVIEDLVITGTGRGITRSTAAGTPEFRFLEIGTNAVAASVTISGLRMSNGRVTSAIGASGGCIYLRNGSLTVADSTLETCVAEGNDGVAATASTGKGGAIFAETGTLEIANSAFNLNSARGGDTTFNGARGGAAAGGAIHGRGITSLVLESTTMSSNSAISGTGGAGISLGGAAEGGCIYLFDGSLTVADSTLEECLAQGSDNAAGTAAGGRGGAIYANTGTLGIANSAFNFNSARGGATSLDGAFGIAAEGGAVYASEIAPFVLENTTMFSNFAIGGAGVSSGGVAKGGAVLFVDSNGTMTGTAFIANAAGGGAASAADGTSGTSHGGAIAFEGDVLTITDTDLTANVVTGADNPQGRGGNVLGGAIYSHGGTLDIVESDVSDNEANGGTGISSIDDGRPQGGGLYLVDTTATIDDCSIESNAVSGYEPKGGGIAVVDASAAASPVLIAHSTIASNTAVSSASASGPANGGGVYQERDMLTLRNTTLSANTADAGGGLFQDNGTTIVTLSTFSANTANTVGGAIAVDSPDLFGHTMDLKNVTISGNFAGATAGGLYITGSPLAPAVTTVNLHNTVVTNNTNGGIHLAEDHTQPVLVSGNSIVGAQASGADCSAAGAVVFTSDGGNLESGTSCAFTTASDQQSVADLGLDVLGSYGGETLTHDLLVNSLAINSGKKPICNRQANKKDQRGLARFYDGNGDRGFECDSGAVEYQGLLANPGFEEPLDAAGDWSLTASGGGDVRTRLVAAPSGKFAFVFQANAVLETLSQTRPISGGPGETYRLTLLGQGSGLTVGEEMTITLESKAGGATVDTRTCRFAFPSATFSAPPPACVLNTTGAYDALNVVVGWDGATTGSLSLDAMSLTQR